MGLKVVEQLMEQGEYETALATIEEATSESDITSEEKLAYDVFRSNAILEIGNADSAAVIARGVLKESKKAGHKLIAISAAIAEGDAMRRMGRLTEASDLADLAEELIWEIGEIDADIRSLQLARVFRLRGVIWWAKGALDKALIDLSETQVLLQDLKGSREFAAALNNVGIVFMEKGNFRAALAHFKESLSRFIEIGNPFDRARMLNNIGEIHKFTGDIDSALRCYEEGRSWVPEHSHINFVGITYNNIGESYQLLGELHVALAYYQRAFSIFQQMSNHDNVGVVLVNIGSIHESLGALHFALSYYMQSLALMQRMGSERDIARPLHRIGAVHRQLGQTVSAKGFFTRSLEFREKTGRSLDIAECLHDLVSMLGENGQMPEAEAFLQRMEKLSEVKTDRVVGQYYRLTLAGLMKNRKRIKDMAMSQAMLSDLLEEEDLQHSLKVKAMLSLIELLIIEFRTTANLEAFEEIKELSRRLENHAKSSQSHSLLAETYLVGAQFALVESKAEKAKRLLDKAQYLANESGLRALGRRIQEQQARLKHEPEVWGDLDARGASLAERMDLAQLEETLAIMAGGHLKHQPSVTRERPVMLLLLARSGIPLYSKHFVESKSQVADDHLTAGFLAAIHSLGNDAFHASGGMTKIQQKKHTLIMYTQEPLLFCYAIKGSAFAAQERLRGFAEMLRASPTVWSALTSYVPVLSETQTYGFDNLISLVFDPLPEQEDANTSTAVT